MWNSTNLIQEDVLLLLLGVLLVDQAGDGHARVAHIAQYLAGLLLLFKGRSCSPFHRHEDRRMTAGHRVLSDGRGHDCTGSDL